MNLMIFCNTGESVKVCRCSKLYHGVDANHSLSPLGRQPNKGEEWMAKKIFSEDKDNKKDKKDNDTDKDDDKTINQDHCQERMIGKSK